mmetsp:Transcript_113177/g.316245  ORF Transcript_113177/g.316245 Transcript_113177/m.316245 type:complete len:313 (-) Transcript_113177:434-1372(-)
MHVLQDARATEHHAGVHLDEGRPRPDLLICGLRGVHAADADDGNGAARQAVDFPDGGGASGTERLAAEAAAADCRHVALARERERHIAVARGVRDDEAIDGARGEGHVHELAKAPATVLPEDGRGELQEHRGGLVSTSTPRRADACQQGRQGVALLEGLPFRGVRAGDVEHQKVGVGVQAPKAGDEVVERSFAKDRRAVRLRDVHPEGGPRRTARHLLQGGEALEPFGDHLGAIVVQPHPVDDGLVARYAEAPRLWVAIRGEGGDGADFSEAQAPDGPDLEQRHQLRILVEACCNTKRRLEPEPTTEHLLLD